MTVARFPRPEKALKRDWGHEVVLLVAPQKYSMKLITMKAGKKGGLQKHHLKDEAGIITSGSMKIIYDDGKGDLISRVVGVGDTFHFPPGAVHQGEAITDCSYIEVSTPHFNDRIHCEADYGIEKEEGGLPSTELSEVEIR